MNGCNSECFLLGEKDGSCSNTFLMQINTVHIMQTQTKVKQKKRAVHIVFISATIYFKMIL